jgi:hypothetical protein
VPDPTTEAHNGDSTEVLAATAPPPAEVDDDDDLLDDPDLEGFDVDAPDEFPIALQDDALPDDAAIDHVLSDIPDELEERLARLEASAAPIPGGGDEIDERIKRLEEAAQALADAELKRDGRRVRRKVSAASLGALVAAAIPVFLQLVGALNLSPEVTSTISAGAALVGAFAAGWTTPERAPSLDAQTVQTLVRAP